MHQQDGSPLPPDSVHAMVASWTVSSRRSLTGLSGWVVVYSGSKVRRRVAPGRQPVSRERREWGSVGVQADLKAVGVLQPDQD